MLCLIKVFALINSLLERRLPEFYVKSYLSTANLPDILISTSLGTDGQFSPQKDGDVFEAHSESTKI